MNEEQDIYSFWSIHAASHAYHLFPRYTLVYLYSGQLHLRNQCGEALSIVRGDCAFIGRDSYSHLYAEPEVDAPCRMLYFSFPRHFLCEFYQTLDSSFRKHTMEALPPCISCRRVRDREFLPVVSPLPSPEATFAGSTIAVKNDRSCLYLNKYGQTICGQFVRLCWKVRNGRVRPVEATGRKRHRLERISI